MFQAKLMNKYDHHRIVCTAQIFPAMLHVFYKHIFFLRSGSDILSQNLKGGSNYASDMLILVSWG